CSSDLTGPPSHLQGSRVAFFSEILLFAGFFHFPVNPARIRVKSAGIARGSARPVRWIADYTRCNSTVSPAAVENPVESVENRFSRGFFHHLHRVFHNLWKTFPHNSLDNPLCQDGNLPIFARFPPLFLAKFPSFSAGAPCGRQRSPPCAKSSSDPGENGCHLPTGPV